jgi:hypothetical protein
LSAILILLLDKGTQINQRRSSLAFGNLAVMVALVRNYRSMALRPRLSTSLPLSNEQMIRFQKKSLANCQACEDY